MEKAPSTCMMSQGLLLRALRRELILLDLLYSSMCVVHCLQIKTKPWLRALAIALEMGWLVR